MIQTCGPLPDYMEEKRQKTPEEQGFFHHSYFSYWPEEIEPYTTPLQHFLYMEVDTLSGADIHVLCDFLSSMLQMDPKDWVSPLYLLHHQWLLEDGIGSLNYPCRCDTVGL